MLGGGLHIDYTIGGGLFLTYRDQTASTTCLQDVLYADDLALVAETRKELQHMLEVLDKACTRWGMSMNIARPKSCKSELENNNLPMNNPSPYKAKPWKRFSPFPILEVRRISQAR